jgi:gamma-glutamyltranspeptidase/glutathione hydrolase
VRAAGVTGSELPRDSPLCVTVPGAVSFWESALQAWGSKPLADVLLPAIELAEQGFPVHPMAAFEWAKGAALIARQGGPGARALVDENGAAPRAGQLWRNPDLAATLRRVAEHGAAKGAAGGVEQPLPR